jgi:hypothetical protein
MSNPDPPSPPRPPPEDFRQKPPSVPGSAGGTAGEGPGDKSGFLSRCVSILLIVFGVGLAGPGFCYYSSTHIAVDFTSPLIFVAGVLLIVGGSIWLSEIGRARRARRRRQG